LLALLFSSLPLFMTSIPLNGFSASSLNSVLPPSLSLSSQFTSSLPYFLKSREQEIVFWKVFHLSSASLLFHCLLEWKAILFEWISDFLNRCRAFGKPLQCYSSFSLVPFLQFYIKPESSEHINSHSDKRAFDIKNQRLCLFSVAGWTFLELWATNTCTRDATWKSYIKTETKTISGLILCFGGRLQRGAKEQNS